MNIVEEVQLPVVPGLSRKACCVDQKPKRVHEVQHTLKNEHLADCRGALQ